ncbi:MAG: hypothetical protein OQJ96_10380 [Flavobacteriales bacterium]|nr:hypothetical protein [Flavobacteriales bacterium]MCW8913437.1 hypothetical protein [Flavobacteriales bacterium]MCW8938499.1 hypothetical protein [Flavobacteriales bacterium]MCW8967482.1 hypothetical protein [Flavobacteriales bacterium]MCW8990278.1 hypothetical protein [Flavobacteriales bacterium]
MNRQDVKNIIQEELKGNPDLSNAHGVELDKCLIEPIRQTYLDSFNDNKKIELWTVLEETDDGDGYKIVFDYDDNIFGLGMKTNNDELVFIGYYGTFTETLRGM